MATSTVRKSVLKKQNQVNELTEILKDAKTVVAFEYPGLTVENLTELRVALRDNDSHMKIYKNNITKRAAVEAGLQELEEVLVGALALVISNEDVVSPAKVVFDYAKKFKKLNIVGGVIEGRVVGDEEIKQLAQLPSRETLLTQLAVGLYGPISQLGIGLHMLFEEKESEGAN